MLALPQTIPQALAHPAGTGRRKSMGKEQREEREGKGGEIRGKSGQRDKDGCRAGI